jgi:pimeloyl-ACP methyl ester carboxylesterase
MAHFIYLHGFASSPRSTKAVFFRERLARLGHSVVVPDLEEGDFQALTITRQLAVVRREIARVPGELALIGSSMGGYLALLAAAEEPRIRRLVVMAPAIDMKARWTVRYGEDALARWKATGVAPTFHHAHGEERLIGYGLYEDLDRYDPAPPVRVPTLAFMGRKDETVAPSAVERWAGQNPSVRLRWLDSGHELIDVLETIWIESAAFLGIESAGGSTP